MHYVHCIKCGIILDLETEAIEYKREYYCLDHYEEVIQEEQEKEVDNEQ